MRGAGNFSSDKRHAHQFHSIPIDLSTQARGAKYFSGRFKILLCSQKFYSILNPADNAIAYKLRIARAARAKEVYYRFLVMTELTERFGTKRSELILLQFFLTMAKCAERVPERRQGNRKKGL